MSTPDLKCKCGHPRSRHTQTLTHCQEWHPEDPPNVYRSREEKVKIMAMTKEERQQRFGIIFCTCMTFTPVARVA